MREKKNNDKFQNSYEEKQFLCSEKLLLYLELSVFYL